jgi:hypothetical protein
VIEIDIFGHLTSVSTDTLEKLRDRAAAEAGHSNSARDLSLVLDRALRTGATVALHRGETRALLTLLEDGTTDPEITALAAAIHARQPSAQ